MTEINEVFTNVPSCRSDRMDFFIQGRTYEICDPACSTGQAEPPLVASGYASPRYSSKVRPEPVISFAVSTPTYRRCHGS